MISKRFAELTAMLALGFLLGGGVIYSVGTHQMHAMASTATASQAQAKVNYDRLRALYADALRRNQYYEKQIQEIGSASTMIVEPSVGVPMGNSVLGKVLSAITAQQRVRWMIPYKVTPFVYGNPGGTSYFFVDHAGVAYGGGAPIKVMQ